MKIYAIRDRILAYYRQPFLAPNDNEVQAAISVALIRGENIDWQAAPHHFEIWSLGGVDQEEGTIEVEKKLICTLDSLIRTSVRKGDPGEQGKSKIGSPAGGRQSSPKVPTAPTHAQAGRVPSKAPAKALKRKKASGGTRRSNKGS